MENIINVGLVRDYIKKYNLSVKEFCKKCKICARTFYKIIKQRGKIRTITIFKFANAMNLYIGDILIKNKHWP